VVGYGRSDWSSKLIRGLRSEAPAGFRSRRGWYREPTPVTSYNAPFASCKCATQAGARLPYEPERPCRAAMCYDPAAASFHPVVRP
jgi:hypothetical protein